MNNNILLSRKKPFEMTSGLFFTYRHKINTLLHLFHQESNETRYFENNENLFQAFLEHTIDMSVCLSHENEYPLTCCPSIHDIPPEVSCSFIRSILSIVFCKNLD
jgi:hypothetical protein